MDNIAAESGMSRIRKLSGDGDAGKTERELRDQVMELLAHALLAGNLVHREYIEKVFRFNGIETDTPWYAVLLIQVTESSSLYFKRDKKDFSFYDFVDTYVIVRSIIEEMMEPFFMCLTAAKGDEIPCILGIRQEDAGDLTRAHAIAVDRIKLIAAQSASFIQENFGIELSLYVSAVCEGLENIPEAYRSVENMAEYMKMIGAQMPQILTFKDFPEIAPDNPVQAELFTVERGYINAAAGFRFKEAAEFFDELIGLQTCVAPLGIKDLRDFAQERVRAAFSLLSRSVPRLTMGGEDYSRFVRILDSAEDIDGIREACGRFLRDMGEAAERSMENRDEIIVKIMEYINQNYSDPNLSVSTISERYGISLSSLSRSFKRETGVNILSHIHSVRLARAKELLRSTDLTLFEVGERSGYISGWSLSRAFKRLEGMTPTEFREPNRRG